MTVRDLYDAALIEINKLEAPSMLLEDYNYFINKAIQQYINKVYNRYEINQQATDDLLALKRSVSLFVNKFSEMGLSDDNYYFSVLPKDYLHILNCIVKFDSVKDSNNCATKSTNKSVVARKLTSDIYPSIINNAYFKPSYRTPYYTIIKLSENVVLLNKILNPCNNIIISNESVLDSVLFPCEESEWKGGYVINIKCGDDYKFEPCAVYIDYIKTPEQINLTEEQLDGEDTTKEMEFSDYICYEIINEFVKLLLENTSDPRLQTNIPINQTIIPQTSE